MSNPQPISMSFVLCAGQAEIEFKEGRKSARGRMFPCRAGRLAENRHALTHAINRTLMLFMIAVALMSATAGVVLAQGYPSRPVRVVVGFAPGGPTDVLARAVAPKLGELLGQSIIVGNRPGASGNIGAEIVAKAAADGHTLLFGDVTFIANISLFKSLPFNPRTDFLPVGYAGSTPQVLVVPPNLEPKSASEFVAWVKARPGKVSYGTAGSGSPPHLAAELFKQAHGLDIQAVHYKGTGAAFPDLLSGRLQMMIMSSSASKPNIDAGRLRAPAISGAKRSPGLPNVPTFAEAGTPLDLDRGAWWGLYTPGQTPREIVVKLNDALTRALAQADVRDRLAALQIEMSPMTQDDYRKFVQTETSKWAQVIQRAKITVD